MHFLKMIILKGELMRFIIYVDNVQQYIGLHARFAKKICNATYIYRAQSDNFVPTFKEYIDKIYAIEIHNF